MLQREVVARITAPPGSTDRGYPPVLVEAHYEAVALFDVPPDAFSPCQKFGARLSGLRCASDPGSASMTNSFCGSIVSAGFAQRRKTIYNNLRSAPEGLRACVEAGRRRGALLEAAGVEPSRRAETLTLEDWSALARNLQTPPVEPGRSGIGRHAGMMKRER